MSLKVINSTETIHYGNKIHACNFPYLLLMQFQLASDFHSKICFIIQRGVFAFSEMPNSVII